MKTKRALPVVGIVVFLVMLLAVSVSFAAGKTNPKQKKVMQHDRIMKVTDWTNRDPERESPIKINGAPVILRNGSLLKCTQAPTLGGKGKWSVSYDSSMGMPDEMSVYLSMKDWCSDYTTIYAKDYSSFTSSVTGPSIVSGGQYSLTVYQKYGEGYYADTYYFTIQDDEAHTSLTEKVDSVVSSCKASSQWQTALNLHDWLVNNVYYDHSLNYYGADMILRGYGVCDGYSKAFYMMCRKAGIPVRRILNDGHAWDAIRLDGKWYYVDPTWDDPGDEKTKKSGYEHHNYFCLNEELLLLDHPSPYSWQNSDKYSCTALDANYYVYRKEWNGIGNRVRDPDTYAMTTYSALIARQIAANRGGNYIPWGDFYYITAEGGYSNPWNEGTKKITITDVKRSWMLLAYAMSHTPMNIEGYGSIKLTVSISEQYGCFIYQIQGFDTAETGTLTLPAKTKKIEEGSFRGIKASTVVIPEGCKTIETEAFADSKVHKVSIPASVTSIDSTAFDGCSPLLILCPYDSKAAEAAMELGILWFSP